MYQYATWGQAEAERLAGESKARHPMILGHNGAASSGLELMKDHRASATSNPPMLANTTSKFIVGYWKVDVPMPTQHDFSCAGPATMSNFFLNDERGKPIGEALNCSILWMD